MSLDVCNVLISGATFPDGSKGDVCIRDGAFVAADAATSVTRRIDADGLRILPGLIDLHTHLREPGKEEAETIHSGTQAAARGGYTAVFAMANLNPVTDTAARAQHIVDVAKTAYAQVIPVGAITRGLAGEELADIAAMHEATGTPMFSDDGRCVMNAQFMREAFEIVREFDGILAQHAQDHNLAPSSACCHESCISRELGLGPWPSEAESVIVSRDVQLAKLTGARLHVCHVSTAESVEIVRWAKKKGIRVTAEVTPHHLYLTAEKLRSLSPVYKVNPPLRTDEHVEAMRQGLADGTIDVVGTDHAPHTKADKDKPFSDAAFGMIGIEESLAVVMETMIDAGRMDWPTLVDRMSLAPARIGGLAHGRLFALGTPANLTLIDPAARAVVDKEKSLSKSRNNPYHGINLPSPVQLTIYDGKISYEAGGN